MMAGVGPIPIPALVKGAVSFDIEQRISELESRTSFCIRNEYGNVESLGAIARHGIFVFDWSDIFRSRNQELEAYELIAAPQTPLKSSKLPSDLAYFANLVRFSTILFSSLHTLDVRMYFPCVDGESALP